MNHPISPDSFYIILFGLIGLHVIIFGISTLRYNILNEILSNKKEASETEEKGKISPRAKDLIHTRVDEYEEKCNLKIEGMLSNFTKCLFLGIAGIVVGLFYEFFEDPEFIIPLAIIAIIMVLLFCFWWKNTKHLIEINRLPYELHNEIRTIVYKDVYRP